ncbi:MAG: peptide deformylase [Eubacteriaceae bacterium]|jgi:peptide deformylase|nr:peptide deformylase [Eubacteriaceae bacterium]
MALRFIRTEEDEILYKKSKPVKIITERIKQLLDDMEETMEANSGLGLAAVQVGVLRRAIVIRYEEQLYRLLNPEIISCEGEVCGYEGCLSVPGKHMSVMRPETVTVQAMDENGETVIIEATDQLARIFCHEIDHLDGVLYVQKADYTQPVIYDRDLTEEAENEPDEENNESK